MGIVVVCKVNSVVCGRNLQKQKFSFVYYGENNLLRTILWSKFVTTKSQKTLAGWCFV